jgi:hypothetical protein
MGLASLIARNPCSWIWANGRLPFLGRRYALLCGHGRAAPLGVGGGLAEEGRVGLEIRAGRRPDEGLGEGFEHLPPPPQAAAAVAAVAADGVAPKRNKGNEQETSGGNVSAGLISESLANPMDYATLFFRTKRAVPELHGEVRKDATAPQSSVSTLEFNSRRFLAIFMVMSISSATPGEGACTLSIRSGVDLGSTPADAANTGPVLASKALAKNEACKKFLLSQNPLSVIDVAHKVSCGTAHICIVSTRFEHF